LCSNAIKKLFSVLCWKFYALSHIEKVTADDKVVPFFLDMVYSTVGHHVKCCDVLIKYSQAQTLYFIPMEKDVPPLLRWEGREYVPSLRLPCETKKKM